MDEDKHLEMSTGEIDENVYDAKGREELVEDGEISTWEEGFMEGAEKDGQLAKCAYCGASLMDADDVVEKEVDGELKRYCSASHAEKDETDLI